MVENNLYGYSNYSICNEKYYFYNKRVKIILPSIVVLIKFLSDSCLDVVKIYYSVRRALGTP